MLEGGKTRPIDLGRAGDRCFCLMAGFGFDAIVVQNVVPGVKDIFGPGAYALATFQTLAQYQSTSVTLTLDGEEVQSEAYLVVVANASSYALAQVKMAPFASIDDGWLDVCVFERAPGDRIGFVTQIMAMFARRHLRDPRVRYYRARRIVIDSTPPSKASLTVTCSAPLLSPLKYSPMLCKYSCPLPCKSLGLCLRMPALGLKMTSACVRRKCCCPRKHSIPLRLSPKETHHADYASSQRTGPVPGLYQRHLARLAGHDIPCQYQPGP